jgi:hypothetical protein
MAPPFEFLGFANRPVAIAAIQEDDVPKQHRI